MSASQNNITLLLNQQDADGVNVLNRTIGAISYDGLAGELEIKKSPDSSSHAFDLVTPTLRQIYIKNTHATGVLTIVGTPAGGASATLCKLGPGDVFVYWSPSEASGVGYTALAYTATVVDVTFEVFLGG